MTVRELYNWCKAYRYKEAHVYLVKDWEKVDEDGNLTDLYALDDVCEQVTYLDDGLDFVNVHEVLLSFKEKCATRQQD